MKKTIKNNLPLITIALIVTLFLFYFLSQKNYEFILYIIVVYIIVAIMYFINKKFNYSKLTLWGFAVWALLHMLGGSASINGTRLYDVMLVNIIAEPFNILKYDQFVHFYCYVVIAMIVFETLKNYFKSLNLTAYIFIVLASIGIGSLNEVIEFAAVVFLGNTGVGDYYNTALDLVFNLLGAIIGVFISVRKK